MDELHTWFRENQRPFPWREERTPYKVWISEVMLQQTRASVVVPYFLRWMARFPDVRTLAGSTLEEVIKAWEGLGYYSRVRNLHKGARQIVSLFDGKIPDSREALEAISGLGSYTVGAILSFGFQKRAAAVDGNAARVISRYFAIEENICSLKARKKLEEHALSFAKAEEPWIAAEALIELGATICLPKPRCGDCPISAGCVGRRLGIAEALPIKNKEKGITLLTRIVAVVESQGRILVRKEEAGKIMADLYEFPYFEAGPDVELGKSLGFDVECVGRLPEIIHTFTRYKARLFPYLLKAADPIPVTGAAWVLRERLLDLPFSAGHRKIARQL
jgi:A/G-specific adenine glycosylase